MSRSSCDFSISALCFALRDTNSKIFVSKKNKIPKEILFFLVELIGIFSLLYNFYW